MRGGKDFSGAQFLLYLPWRFDMLGGVDVVVDYLWRGIEFERPGAAIIGQQSWSESGFSFDLEGRRFFSLNMPKPEFSSSVFAFRYLMTLAKRLPILFKFLSFNNIQVVNAHFPTLNLVPLAILKKIGLWDGRIYLSFHGTDVDGLDENVMFWRFISSQINGVSACSQALANEVLEKKIFTGVDVSVIHNGIDAARFVNLGLGFENAILNSPYILSVGNYVEIKGQDNLLHAFSFISEIWRDYSLVFVGGTDNGKWLHCLKNKCDELGLRDRVYFLENQSQPQVSSLMRNADLFIHTSKREAFGMVLIEAGSSGLPVIASKVGGVSEIIENPDFGVTVLPNDIDSLVSAIDRLLRCKELRRNVGENLKRRVNEEFSVDNMLFKYKRFLQLID